MEKKTRKKAKSQTFGLSTSYPIEEYRDISRGTTKCETLHLQMKAALPLIKCPIGIRSGRPKNACIFANW